MHFGITLFIYKTTRLNDLFAQVKHFTSSVISCFIMSFPNIAVCHAVPSNRHCQWWLSFLSVLFPKRWIFSYCSSDVVSASHVLPLFFRKCWRHDRQCVFLLQFCGVLTTVPLWKTTHWSLVMQLPELQEKNSI